MRKPSFLVFIFLAFLVAGSYIFLEYFKRGAKPTGKEPISTLGIDSSNIIFSGETQRQRVRVKKNLSYSFQLPRPWKIEVSPFQPTGSPSVNKAFRFEMQHPDKDFTYEWFSPLKFHFYLGELGKYLEQQRAPLSPLAALNSFFGHAPTNCRRIEPPIKNWSQKRSEPVEYYSEVLTDWYEVQEGDQHIYYYLKIEKAPTPGVYGDLGSWTFSGFRFHLPPGQSLTEKELVPAQIFYQTVKREETVDAKS